MKTTTIMSKYRLHVNAFSKRNLQISIRDLHSNEWIADIVMYEKFIYASHDCAIPEKELPSIKDEVEKSLITFDSWDSIPTRYAGHDIIVY